MGACTSTASTSYLFLAVLTEGGLLHSVSCRWVLAPSPSSSSRRQKHSLIASHRFLYQSSVVCGLPSDVTCSVYDINAESLDGGDCPDMMQQCDKDWDSFEQTCWLSKFEGLGLNRCIHMWTVMLRRSIWHHFRPSLAKSQATVLIPGDCECLHAPFA